MEALQWAYLNAQSAHAGQQRRKRLQVRVHIEPS